MARKPQEKINLNHSPSKNSWRSKEKNRVGTRNLTRDNFFSGVRRSKKYDKSAISSPFRGESMLLMTLGLYDQLVFAFAGLINPNLTLLNWPSGLKKPPEVGIPHSPFGMIRPARQWGEISGKINPIYFSTLFNSASLCPIKPLNLWTAGRWNGLAQSERAQPRV